MSRKSDMPGGQLKMPSPTTEQHPAMVHVLTPEYLGIEVADYNDIDDQMIAAASPQRLRRSLIGISPDAENAVGFRPYAASSPRPKPIYVAMTSTSYELLARSPLAMKRHGYNRVESLRKQKHDAAAAAAGGLATFGLSIADTNEDKAAAKRAGAHINEAAERAMREHLATAITPRLELTRKFIEASRHHNLSRIGGKTDMRRSFTDLAHNVIGDMLSAVSTQQEWTGEQLDLVTRSVIKGIVLTGRPGLRAARFRSLLGLSEEWFEYNSMIFRERINWSARTARQALREAAEFVPPAS
jgi:hypothetical protein